MRLDFGALQKMLEDAINAAYADGYIAGGANMRDNILRAAQAPGEARSSQGADFKPPVLGALRPREERSDTQSRAPRGLVADLLKTALRESPGSSIIALEEWVTKADPRVSSKSVGNELRRFAGKRYRRDGRKWFLMGESVQQETAEEPLGDAPAVNYDFLAEGR
jgi:hypothetical protein